MTVLLRCLVRKELNTLRRLRADGYTVEQAAARLGAELTTAKAWWPHLTPEAWEKLQQTNKKLRAAELTAKAKHDQVTATEDADAAMKVTRIRIRHEEMAEAKIRAEIRAEIEAELKATPKAATSEPSPLEPVNAPVEIIAEGETPEAKKEDSPESAGSTEGAEKAVAPPKSRRRRKA